MSAKARRKAAARRGQTPQPGAELRGAAWKPRAAFALVALVALWPLAHRALVAAYDVNPWKLGGWAMYTTAMPPLLIGLFGEQGGRVTTLDAAALPVDAQLLLQRFEQERHALGELRPPDDVAARVLVARPDVERLVVVVQRMTLDADSARMTSAPKQYAYARGQTRTSASTPK